MDYHKPMKLLFAVLVIAAATALAVFATNPRIDLVCGIERVRDAAQKTHTGWRCIHYAAARGDARAVAAALDDRVSGNLRTTRGQTPLILAAQHGRLDVVRALIARGVELEARDGRNGFTALHWAASEYHPAVARALLAAGAEVDAENKWNQTPLWQASWQADQGNTEIAHILIAAGADIRAAGDKGNTPLLMAARAGHTPMIDYLLRLGADIGTRNKQGRTPLFQAVAGDQPEAVRLLLARGADPNVSAGGVAPLELALGEGHREIAELLEANGATGYTRYAAATAFKRGQRAYADGRYDDAIQAYGAAIALRPDDARAYYRRGLAFMASGAKREAETDLDQAIRIDPDNADAREALARLYVDRGDYNDAVTTLDRLLEMQPDNARALYLLGESRHGLGDTAAASTRFSRACSLGFQPACSR